MASKRTRIISFGCVDAEHRDDVVYDVARIGFDPPYAGWGGTTWHFLLLAIPADEDEEIPEDEWEEIADGDDEDDPYEVEWVDMNCLTTLGVLNRKIWDEIDIRIEKQCKAEDRKRRRAARAGKLKR